MHIEKYHASLNDFLIIETEKTNLNKSAKELLNRQKGIGADGLITYNHSTKEVHIYNQDGSDASLCLNGLRCLSLYVVKKYGVEEDVVFKIQNRYYQALIKSLEPFFVEIKLIDFKCIIIEKFLYASLAYPVGFIDVGNKHMVFVLEEKNNDDILSKLSKEYLEEYNINFVKIIQKNTISVTTYERGVGYTLSCGSGSLASALYLNKLGLVDDLIEVKTMIDSIFINLKDNASIKGNAHFVFEVEYEF